MKLTFRYRLKDSSKTGKLAKIASSVNFVWNYCNEANQESWEKFNKTYSGFDLNKKTAGCSKELGLHSQTVQAIGEEYATRSKQFRKPKLNWRSYKRSLGWIPFKASGITLNNDEIRYCGLNLRFYKSRDYGKVVFGSFVQDSKSLVCESGVRNA